MSAWPLTSPGDLCCGSSAWSRASRLVALGGVLPVLKASPELLARCEEVVIGLAVAGRHVARTSPRTGVEHASHPPAQSGCPRPDRRHRRRLRLGGRVTGGTLATGVGSALRIARVTRSLLALSHPWEFLFSDDKAEIHYLNEKADCGFGQGVYANGIYGRTSRKAPAFSNGDPRVVQ